ncbi:MAG: response regulator, partial [Negativicutes bacterium]|nr:response regulator [Negativicutes bacterium]
MAAKVLIVDDAAFMRVMLKDILTNNGYEVVGEAENGRRAIEEFARLRPDLVTMAVSYTHL